MPTNEAMRAAVDLQAEIVREDGDITLESLARVVDDTLRLPALLAVAEAARELAQDIERYENQDGNSDYESYRCLRAELEKLPAKGGPESEATPPPPGADKNWGLEA